MSVYRTFNAMQYHYTKSAVATSQSRSSDDRQLLSRTLEVEKGNA